MPLYEYICRDCENKFEELVGRTVPETSVLCPKCGSENCERLFSTFAATSGGKGSNSSCGGCTGGGFT